MRPLFFASLVTAFLLPVAAAAGPSRPNVVLILVDDLGWTDVGCYGSDFYRTPHIDRLARDSVRFTQAYSACTVCSPTRASILTGKYPARLHVTDWIPGLVPANPKLLPPDWLKHLPLDEVTIARVLKDAGYATASIGKWHLGDKAYYPEKFGFDRNVAGTGAAAPKSYFAPWNIPTLAEGRPGDYLTDRLADEAVRFIDENKARPFFLYLPHFGVHKPTQGKPDVVARARARRRPGQTLVNAAYAAQVESVDDAVGRVRAKLTEAGLADRTVFIFASDNGGHIPTTSNRPLRAGKASCYEGGVRVPLIVLWPGVTAAGAECATPVMSIDFYPTILEIAGIADAAGRRPDGESLAPLLRRTGGLARTDLYWHYPHYQLYQQEGTTPYGAIRSGDWKLIEFYDDMRVELYDLHDDLGEHKDLALEQPRKADELRRRLHAWRESVGAQMPTRNPAYDAARPEHMPAKKPDGD
jgi:arylsulfatase A-like enzyme